jgi:hypothetical protein
MWFNQWLRGWRGQPIWFPWSLARQHKRRPRPPGSRRARRGGTHLLLEQLEERSLLSSYSAASVFDLIADINAANSAGGTNTITLTAPTASPYVLTVVNNSTDGATGLPVIAKNDMLTILGNGDTLERSTASGTPDFRLFDVASGAALTLGNLTLQNGVAFGSGSAAEGGAIWNQGTLVLSAVTVQSNTAQGSDGGSDGANGLAGNDAAGAGLWSAGSLTLQSSTLVQNNHAIGGNGGSGRKRGGVGGNAFGGGVFVASGTATLTGAAVENNGATGGEGGYITGNPRPNDNPEVASGNGSGGGLYVAGGTVNLQSDTVAGNQAVGGQNLGNDTLLSFAGNGYGGGVYVAGGQVSLSNDAVDTNQANDGTGGANTAFGYGGGLYVAGGNVTLSSDTVDSNQANGGHYSPASAYGGGLFVAAGATVNLCNDTVQSNTAGLLINLGLGGGIYIAAGGTAYLDSFTVTNTINNTDHSGLNGSTANIDGTYILQNC